MATLHELETTWSLDDLVRACAYLDMRDCVERVLTTKPNTKKG